MTTNSQFIADIDLQNGDACLADEQDAEASPRDRVETEETTIVTDPVHQVMELGNTVRDRAAIKAVMDSTAFQRLRRISQLGLASFVFPGATHSRFSHSLGACYLANRVLKHLKEGAKRQPTSDQIDKHNLAIRLAALLHDVGHGPFSHSFEHVLETVLGKGGAPSHEDWTAVIISNPASKISAALSDYGISPAAIASIIKKRGDLAEGNGDGQDYPTFLREIVSSQIDVDRMDYLARDSHFAGVSIGKVDTYYLINCLTVVQHGHCGDKTLGIVEKGIKAYEGFVLARQLMNRTLYYHHKVKVLEFMMERLVREIILRPDETDAAKDIAPYVPAYLMRLATAIRAGSIKDVASKEEFMRQTLDDYLDLTEDSIWTLVSRISRSESPLANGIAGELAGRLLNRRVLQYHPIEPYKVELLKGALTSKGLISDDDFGIVEASTTAYKASDEHKVFVQARDGTIQGITSRSEIISAVRDRPEAETLLVVLDKGKAGQIEDIARDVQGIRKQPKADKPATG